MSELTPYEATDRADELQIATIDSIDKEILGIRGRYHKKVLSYQGIKWLVLKMSEKGHPLEIVGEPKPVPGEVRRGDTTEWFWEAMIKFRNSDDGFGVHRRGKLTIH